MYIYICFRRCVYDKGHASIVRDLSPLFVEVMNIFSSRLPPPPAIPRPLVSATPPMSPLTVDSYPGSPISPSSSQSPLSQSTSPTSAIANHIPLVHALCALWESYRNQILPSLDALLHPLRTDARSKDQKGYRVHDVLLRAWRDHVLCPILDRFRLGFQQLPVDLPPPPKNVAYHLQQHIHDPAFEIMSRVIQMLGQISNVEPWPALPKDSENRRKILSVWQMAITKWRMMLSHRRDPRMARLSHHRRRTTGATSTTKSATSQKPHASPKILIPQQPNTHDGNLSDIPISSR